MLLFMEIISLRLLFRPTDASPSFPRHQSRQNILFYTFLVKNCFNFREAAYISTNTTNIHILAQTFIGRSFHQFLP